VSFGEHLARIGEGKPLVTVAFERGDETGTLQLRQVSPILLGPADVAANKGRSAPVTRIPSVCKEQRQNEGRNRGCWGCTVSMDTKITETSLVPSLAHVLETMAYHIRSLATECPVRTDAPYSQRVRFGCGLGGYGPGCPTAHVNLQIVPCTGGEVHGGPWGVWAQVTMRNGLGTLDGQEGDLIYSGNRCGAEAALTRHYAPVIAWVAAYWAEQSKAKGGVKKAAVAA